MKYIKNLKWIFNIVFCISNLFLLLSLYFKFSFVVLGKICYRYVFVMFYVILYEYDLCLLIIISFYWVDLIIGFIVLFKKKII